MPRFATALALLFVGGCASAGSTGPAASRVTVADLVAAPEAWDGRRVEITGLVVSEFENLGLYASWEDYCPREGWGQAIYVNWGDVRPRDAALPRRMATVRGTFRNVIGVERIDNGEVVVMISTGAPGPGPLTDVRIVRWHGRTLPACDG